MQRNESVPSILESDATGKVAEIYADIRQVLGTSIVNLVWRNLATMPDALEWTWSTAKPLYLGPAPGYAEAVRRAIDLPAVSSFSSDTLTAAGLSNDDVAKIRDILDSYQYSDALALVVLSALVMHLEPIQQETVSPLDGPPRPLAVKLPELPPMQSLKPEVVRLIEELNGFGEDANKSLIASMYRHLGYWPTYLSLVRTMLVPFEANGQLHALTRSTRALARSHGRTLAQHLRPSTPPDTLQQTLAAALSTTIYFAHDWNLFVDPHGDGRNA
ncbi:hypothetical protein [Bradyrhizobium sp. AZCC 2289]|uniref:hypothetical protein n=1 Tax=Bradyrhizobium sp. AZCC 2289 TaxID=3117026 RepID=UPI002FF18531